MDYKKIIKSRETRVALLSMLNFIPDKLTLKLQYWIKFGRKLDLKNPKRLTEKLQWYKLYYRTPLMTQCAGKNDVRQYVESKGLSHILNEQLGVYDDVDQIDFDSLPNQFVIKETKGSSAEKVYVCTDKQAIDVVQIKAKIRPWVEKGINKLGENALRRRNAGREWAYNGVDSKLVVEKYIDSSNCKNGLLSYKIFCFNGEPRFVYIIADVKDGYYDAGYGIYSTDFARLPYNRVGEVALTWEEEKPENWDEMMEIARTLSSEFPHVRVDLYNVQGKIIFGELTFYNDSGYMKYNPDEFDFISGDMFQLPEKIQKIDIRRGE